MNAPAEKLVEIPGDRLCMYCGQPKARHERPEDADDPTLLSCRMKSSWVEEYDDGR